MKAEDIRKYVKDLNIGPDEDISQLGKDFTEKLAQDAGGLGGAVETLEELSVEINERLAQVDDEERAAALERKLKVVEEAAAELAKRAAEEASKPARQRSVLIADDSEERIEDPRKTRPVAIDPSEEKAAVRAEGNATANPAGAAQSNAGQGSSYQTESSSATASKESNEKKLEKEAGELIKQKQKELKEREKEQKRLEKEQQKQNAEADKSSDSENKKEDQGNKDTGAVKKQPFLSRLFDRGTSDPGQMDPRLATAMKQYYDRNYSKARDGLQQLANDKHLSKSDHGTAEFWYGQMLAQGLGGPVDEAASKFWIGEAAKHKNVSALLSVGADYAEAQPTDNADNVEKTVLALKCFETADKLQEGGNDTAKTKYIEVCETKPIYRSAKNRACDYCDDLAAKKSDAYEKKQYEDKKELIRQNYKANNASKHSGGGVMIMGARDFAVLIGSLAVIIADFFIFLTVQNKGDKLPNVVSLDGISTGKIDGLLEKFGNFVSKTMALVSETLSDTSVNVIIPGALVFGLLLFAGGKLLAGLEYPQSHGRITEVVYEAATAVTLLTLFGNIVLNISSEASTIYLGGAVAVGIIMIIIMIITKIITSFFRK